MKTQHFFLVGLLAIIFSSCFTLRDYGYGDDYNSREISFEAFYDALSPYGAWVKDYHYGYVWVPRVGRDFRPYATNGYWVMTDYGNTWVSNYSWGWAPFHYGRWFYDDDYGWAWLPGYDWAPAWVSWRSGDGYYGWAPLTPRMGVSVNIDIPIWYWVFLPHRYMYYSDIDRYYLERRRYGSIYNRTTIINNTYIYDNNRYYCGPSRREYERVSGRAITARRLENASRAGQSSVTRDAVRVYRPAVSSSRGATSARRSSDMYGTRRESSRRVDSYGDNSSRATTRRGGNTNVGRSGATTSREASSGRYSRSSSSSSRGGSTRGATDNSRARSSSGSGSRSVNSRGADITPRRASSAPSRVSRSSSSSARERSSIGSSTRQGSTRSGSTRSSATRGARR